MTSTVEREIGGDAGNRPFKLCVSCAHRLEQFALRPLEWYRLAALHGPLSYYLHDDFYDQEGNADANEIPIVDAQLFQAPKLEQVSADIPALLDYCLTRWNLEGAAVEALRAHRQNALLEAIIELAEERNTTWTEGRCYQIAAQVLGPVARAWIDTRWQQGTHGETMFAFFEAAAACLSHEEAVPKALKVVEQLDRSHLSFSAQALAPFQSSAVLAWIEKNVSSPVSESWGRLAAVSKFSWSIAARWLEAGRPTSLVALDALSHAVGAVPELQRAAGVQELSDSPAPETMLRSLREYAARDPAPRVTRAVDGIAAVIVRKSAR